MIKYLTKEQQDARLAKEKDLREKVFIAVIGGLCAKNLPVPLRSEIEFNIKDVDARLDFEDSILDSALFRALRS